MNNGYTHRFGKTTGGIDSILLTPVCNIRHAAFDRLTGRCLRVDLHDPEKLFEHSFAENAAAYREETGRRNGVASVVHTLKFHTDRIDPESDALIRRLAEASHCGLAAVITTRNRIRLLVGYSESHGGERPLRLENISADSGKKHTDEGHEAISLISRDAAKACLIDGKIG
jgi:hypothetical protein